jgi:hypothetical protein
MNEQQKRAIQEEVEKTIHFFVENDLHWLGYVSEDTIEAARVQKVELSKEILSKRENIIIAKPSN